MKTFSDTDNQPMVDYLMLAFLSVLFNVPYDSVLKLFDIAMKTPAIRKLKEEINVNQNGIYTPIKEKTVDDAVDAWEIIADEFNKELYSDAPDMLELRKFETKESALKINQLIKKRLADSNILE